MEQTLTEILAELKGIKELLADKEAYETQVLTPAAAARYTHLTTRTIRNYKDRHILTLTERDGVRGFTIRDLNRIKKG